ncbi:MAG: flavodoxin family protein [Nitrospirae bacterium]|nr:flavodoxin family protein [Nitrospirota bacterium]
MKVIAFLGSPRKDGNTDLLLKEVMRGVNVSGLEVETFDLNSMDIQPCQDCGGCDDTGTCIVHDDMDRIYHSIRAADRIVLASPVFFFSLSAQAKAMIDRCQCFWCEKYVLKKPVQAGKFGRKGLLLLVGGMKKEVGVQCADTCAGAFFKTISVPEHVTLSYLGIDKKGEILKHPASLKEAFEAGKKLVSWSAPY